MNIARLKVDFQNYDTKQSTTLSKYRGSSVFMNQTVFDDTRPCWIPPLALENLGDIFACVGDYEKKRSQKQKKEWMRYRQNN